MKLRKMSIKTSLVYCERYSLKVLDHIPGNLFGQIYEFFY